MKKKNLYKVFPSTFFNILLLLVIFFLSNCNEGFSILFEEPDRTPPAAPEAPAGTTFGDPDSTIVINLAGGDEKDFSEFKYTLTGIAPSSCSDGLSAQTTTDITIDRTTTLMAIACDKTGNASAVTTRVYTYEYVCDSSYEIRDGMTDGNDDETQLNSLSQCSQITGFLIIQNSTLVNVNALSRLSTIDGNFYIQDNTALENIDGLSSLSSVGGLVWFSNNDLIQNLNAFGSLTSVTGDISLRLNDGLTDISGLNNLSTAGGSITILENNNTLFTSINGFSGLTSVAGDLWIHSNQYLENIDALINITSIGAELSISSNDALTNLNGLDSVRTIGTSLSIMDNDSLPTCEAEAFRDQLDGPLGITVVISGNDSSTTCN